jgi:hypothetical protein
MITVICFSKDRACQLELLLRSMHEKLNVFHSVVVQYTATTEEFQKGFNKLQQFHPYIKFQKESSFKDTLVDILKTVNTEYILFHTDDDVYLQDVSLVCAPDELNDGYHCFSLRMNPTIDRCYPANNKKIKAPRLNINDYQGLMSWNWKEAEDQHTCWGYPMALNSHIYRSKDIIPLINKGKYHHPNSLECWLNQNRWHDKPYMLSFTETKVFNVQNNFVQGPRMAEIQEYGVSELNNEFLAGKRISTDNIYGLRPNAAHGVIDYKLKYV